METAGAAEVVDRDASCLKPLVCYVFILITFLLNVGLQLELQWQ